MKIDDFLLIPQMDMPARVVQLFYGKNINYYGGQPIKLNVASFGLGISKYYEMSRFKGKAKPDNRCSTIEVQSRTTLDLAPD
ncbi:MAG: hypothetical protein NTZ34_06585, partial [Chloroflexi bacterium]|nr:hypothetical protein [Chloroflexota bacterium]